MHKLQGRTVVNGYLPMKIAASVSGGQFLRWSERTDFTPTPMNRNANPFVHKVSEEYHDQYLRDPATRQDCPQVNPETIGLTGLCGSDDLGLEKQVLSRHSTPK